MCIYLFPRLLVHSSPWLWSLGTILQQGFSNLATYLIKTESGDPRFSSFFSSLMALSIIRCFLTVSLGVSQRIDRYFCLHNSCGRCCLFKGGFSYYRCLAHVSSYQCDNVSKEWPDKPNRCVPRTSLKATTK